MRVSACAWAADSLEMAKALSHAATSVTHNHPEGIKGAEATTVATFLARQGASLKEIRKVIETHYYFLKFTLENLRATYSFNSSCQGTVPQALFAFFESTSFEDAIRNAISIGGDSDTVGAITGAVAEAYYGVPSNLREQAYTFMDERQLKILNRFEAKFGKKDAE